MPRLQVHGNRPLALSSPLVNVARGIVKDAQHRYNTVGATIRASNIRALSADLVNRNTNTPCVLGNDCTVLERVINALDAIPLDVEQKAARKLLLNRASTKQGRSCMGHQALGKRIIGLLDRIEMRHVNRNRYAHKHVLGAFYNKLA